MAFAELGVIILSIKNQSVLISLEIRRPNILKTNIDFRRIASDLCPEPFEVRRPLVSPLMTNTTKSV